MRDFFIWILSVALVVSLGWGLAGNWGNVIGLYYVLASGIGFGIYRLIKRSHKKEIKTPIQ